MVWERDDMVGLDAAILMHPDTWKASGHIESFTEGKKKFISDARGSKLLAVSVADEAKIEVKFKKSKDKVYDPENVELHEFIDVKGWKALGNKLSPKDVASVKLVNEVFKEKEKEKESENENENENEKGGEGNGDNNGSSGDVSLEVTNPDKVDDKGDASQASLF